MTLIAHSTECKERLRLRALSFDRVEFDLVSGGVSRPVTVLVASGATWCDATRFPTIASDATASTGSDELDEEVRDMAAELLVVLEAATRAAEARRLAA